MTLMRGMIAPFEDAIVLIHAGMPRARVFDGHTSIEWYIATYTFNSMPRKCYRHIPPFADMLL